MTSAWTLPLIRIELDNLPLGCEFILAWDDAARLFGANDSARQLISIFAGSHGCRALFRRNDLVFEKRLPSVAVTSVDQPDWLERSPLLHTPRRPASDDFPSADCR